MDARDRELDGLRRELRLAQDKLDRFFELVPDLLAIGTPEGGWIKVNAAWQGALGYSSEELLSLSIFDLIHPDDLNSTMQEVGRQQGGRHVLNFVNRFRAKDGQYRWLEWSASPAEDGLLELQGKNEHFKKPKTSIGNNCVSILLERDIPRSNASVSGYKRHGYTQTGASVALPCYGSFCRKSIRISGS